MAKETQLVDISSVIQKDVVFRIFIDLHLGPLELPCGNLLGEQYIKFFVCAALESRLEFVSALWHEKKRANVL